jgi:C4-dicarboxylate transporter DctQ subunit
MDTNGSLKSILRQVNKIFGTCINLFEVTNLIICVGALTGLLIANVIARDFFKSIYFAEEVSEFLVIFTTFVGLSYGVRKARHIRMGAFLDIMHPKLEKVFIIIIAAVSAAVMFVMAYASYDYLINSMTRGHMTPALRVPYWWFYVIIPIGFFMAGIQYLRTIIKNLVEEETWMSPEQQSEYEEEVLQETMK